MKREHQETTSSGGGGSNDNSPSSEMSRPKAKTSPEENDEMLAALGIKVRLSEMSDVAHKLEQLDMLAANDEASFLAYASESVHYNPSDLSNWLDSMLSELNSPPPQQPERYNCKLSRYSSFQTSESSSSVSLAYDVKPVSPASRDRKRMRNNGFSCSSSSSSSAEAAASTTTPPLVVVDSQEAGIRLVHALMACAESVQKDNLKLADSILKQISVLAASQGGAMRKVAGFFAEALARRIYRLSPTADAALEEILRLHFYESCPYLKFAHFTANQAILEAFAGCQRVHVIDFGMKQGLQWPPLLQALALRPGGPPSFRLTGIGPPQPDQSDALQQVGWKLAQLADTIRIDFSYRGFVAGSLSDLEPYMLVDQDSKLDCADRNPEAVAVNSVMEFHHLLARPGAIEKVLGTVRAVRPKIVTLVEQESDHNTGPFLDRFTEALHYYSTMFDSLEGAGECPAAGGQDLVMSEVYLGRQICNVVACEGPDRTERHEKLVQWRSRMNRAGFEPVHLGSNAFKQASMLLALYSGGDGFRVEERDGALTLGWHTRPLIATSAWRAGAGAPVVAR